MRSAQTTSEKQGRQPPDGSKQQGEEAVEPRWAALVAGLSIGGMYLALPERLSIGPSWLLLAIVIVMLVPTTIAHYRRLHHLNHYLGQLLLGIVTLFLIGSVALLVSTLIRGHTHHDPIDPVILLRSAAALWATNVLVFASWYWRLDAGGPNARDMRGVHCSGAFLFPQMTLDENKAEEGAGPVWTPEFVDYMFVAFNTSTALSPTDTAVLSRWAKLLTMLQALISLTIIVILAARAVNIL